MRLPIYGHYPATASERVQWLVAGFVFGALAVLLFHQGAFALLHSLGFTPRAPYSMQATAPFGLPSIWSYTFWGGVWGLLLAAALQRFTGGMLVFAATLFGLVAPTVVAWFVVAPLKGQPVAAGFVPKAMMLGLIINAAWGLGTGIGLALLERLRR